MSSSASGSGRQVNIFKLDNSNIDVLKLLLKMWESRGDEEMVKALAETLVSFSAEKKAYNEIEFYLPQIAQLIIHLEANWSSQTLEYLAIAISQASIHGALQLSSYLVAAMEDYQPEVSGGKPNPRANVALFYRCARLLQNVTRAVVYGSPVLTVEGERVLLFQMTEQELLDMHDHEKSEAAGRIVRSNMAKGLRSGVSEGVSGRLYVNNSGSWQQCFCKVEQRVLFCFKDNAANAQPLKALLLEGCEVKVLDNASKPFSFEVYNPLTMQRFTLAATEQSEMINWARFMQSEATRPPMPLTEHSVTEGQAKRYTYYTQMRAFNTSLVAISEACRQRPEPVRKFFLRKYVADLAVPPLAYMPVAMSLDKYRCVLKAAPCESFASSLSQSVPCTIYLETELHSVGLDLATFLNKELQEYTEEELREGPPPPKSALVLDRPAAEEDDSIDQPRIDSMLRSVGVVGYWKADGAGLEGLEDRFVPPIASVNRGRESIAVPTPETLKSRADRVLAELGPSEVVPGRAAVVNAYMAKLREFEVAERKAERLRAYSPAGHLPTWRMAAVTACSNFDSRQEGLVTQLVGYYAAAFEAASLPVWMQPYKVMPTSKFGGIIEAVPSAYTLRHIKAHSDYPGSLAVYFEKAYGGTAEAAAYKHAVDNFAASMAAYSVVCYLLGVRGRSEANMLLTEKGHVVPTDFQQIFVAQPTSLPLAQHSEPPFMLTPEMVELMGGRFSELFANFASTCGQCLVVARRHFPQVLALLEMYAAGGAGVVTPAALAEFKARHVFGTPDMSVEFEFNFLIERCVL